MSGRLRLDLADHGLLLVSATGLAALLGAVRLALGARDGDALAALREVVLLVLAPLVWLGLRRLVASQYDRRGWDALAPLPAAPAHVLALGLTLTCAVALALLIAAWVAALGLTFASGATLDEPRAAAALRQSVAFLAVWTAYHTAAVTLGRHRLALHGLLLAGLAGWSARGGALAALPGLALLGASSRGAPPPERTEEAVGLALALLIVAAALARWRARAWQGAPRRAAWALGGGGALAALLASGALAPTPPFALDGAAARRAGLPLAVTLRDPAGDASAAALLEAAAPLFEALATRCALTLPEVAVDPDPRLDGRTVVRVALDRPGLLLRANPAAPDRAPARVRARLATLALDGATEGRLRAGGFALVLHGLPAHAAATLPGVSLEQASAWRALGERRAAYALALLALRGQALDPAALTRFAALEPLLGRELTAALAGWVMTRLAACDPDAPWALARAACAARRGPFGGVGERGGAFAAAFEQALAPSGETLEAFVRALGSEAEALRREVGGLAPRLPAGEVWLERDRDAARVVFRAAPGAAAERLVVLHGLATASAIPPAPWREEAPADGRARTASARYPPGRTVVATLARFEPALECDLVAGWAVVRER